MTVQGPIKKQQPDAMSHGGGESHTPPSPPLNRLGQIFFRAFGGSKIFSSAPIGWTKNSFGASNTQHHHGEGGWDPPPSGPTHPPLPLDRSPAPKLCAARRKRGGGGAEKRGGGEGKRGQNEGEWGAGGGKTRGGGDGETRGKMEAGMRGTGGGEHGGNTKGKRGQPGGGG